MAANQRKRVGSKLPDPTDRRANAVAALTAAGKGTTAAGRAVGALAGRARRPLIVTGAAIAGVAAGLTLSKRAG